MEAFTEKRQKTPSNLSHYIEMKYDSEKLIDCLLEKTILSYQLKKQSKSKLNDDERNQLNFYMTKCKDRLSCPSKPWEHIVWYNWNNYSPTTFEKILNELAMRLELEFEQWEQEKPLRELEEQIQREQQKKQLKRVNKKNKAQAKKNKKKEESYNNEEGAQQRQSLLESVKRQIQFVTEQIIKNQNRSLIEELSEPKITDSLVQSTNKKKIIIETKGSTHQGIIDTSQKVEELTMVDQKKEEQLSVSESMDASQTSQREVHQSQLPQQNMDKYAKVIDNRMSEYLECFKKQLEEKAKPFDKYRRISYILLKRQISRIFNKLVGQYPEEEQKLWKFQLFGSYAAGFSLKQSDIDLVLLQAASLHHSPFFTLKQLYEHLSVIQWILDCKIISNTTVPIVTFSISIFGMFKSNAAFLDDEGILKVTQKALNKIMDEYITVDVSVWSIKEEISNTIAETYQEHSGIKNTRIFMKLFREYPSLRDICLIIKQYIRINQLNKPFKGGISSYILVVMIFIILSNKFFFQSQKKSTEDKSTNYIKGLRLVCDFMANQFIPFETVLEIKKTTKKLLEVKKFESECSIEKQHEILKDVKFETLHLKIICPFTKAPLKTSAFQIDSIIKKFRDLGNFLKQAGSTISSFGLEEKKKMKKQFLFLLSELMYRKQGESNNEK